MNSLGDKRLIFSINSGRAGSGYLASLLATSPDVFSSHEPDPQMTGSYLNMVDSYPLCKSVQERNIKAEAVSVVLDDMAPETVYSEISHMFIKTFHDVILDNFDNANIDVIVLRREIPLVLKSFVELRYFTKSNPAWPDWMSRPDAVTAAIPCFAGSADLDEYDLAIAYLVDIEARAQCFMAHYPDIKVHEVRLEALSSPRCVKQLFHDLRISPGEKTSSFIGQIINQRENVKQKFGFAVDLNYCRLRLHQYLARAAKMGTMIPSTLAISPYRKGA